MEFKDKLLLGGAVICAIIIFCVFAANKVNSDPSPFTTGQYYTPKDTTRIGANEGQSWSDFARNNKLECPGIGNTTAKGSLISINGATKYKVIQYFPLTSDELGINTNVCTLNNIQSILQLQDVSACTLGESTACHLVPQFSTETSEEGMEDSVGVVECYEIIAPFAFTFDCSNVDEDRESMTILSSNKQIKIEFNNIVNWFCAGEVGTSTVYRNSGDDVTCTWDKHGAHHASIIGSSKNSDKQGGSAGDLIAYGSDNTTMTLSVVENGHWVTKSWYGILKKQ